MSRPVIFISYSHQDEKEKNKLLAHLTVFQQQGLIDLWSDDRIAPGANWKEEITAAIEQAQVAILLISANFLSSNFISDNEIPNLLKRRKNEGLVMPALWLAFLFR